MRTQVVQCDQCGKSKGKSNDWHTLQQRGPVVMLLLNGGTRQEEIGGGFIDLCGQECVLARIALLMNAEAANVKLRREEGI